MIRLPSVVAALLAGPLVLSVLAVDPPTIRLTKPLAEFPETFDHMNGVTELRDGRVVVTDFEGPSIQLVDFSRGSQLAVGRRGAGPKEYMLPDRPMTGAGDSVLVPDVGQNRFLRLAPDGTVSGSFPFPAASGTGGQFRGADRQGRLYYLGSRYGQSDGPRRTKSIEAALAGAADSAPLLRWDRARNRIDTLAMVGMAPLAKPAAGGSAGHRIIMSRPQPFARQDDWAVTPDGRVAILRASDYHVDWVGTDGRRSRGAANPYAHERVTRADKERILKPAQAMTSGGGKFTVAAASEGDFTWPEFKPPFVPQFTLATPEGRVWVQRSVAEGAEPMYDELDERGQVIRRFVLARGSRVVGFGKGVVYVTRSDEDDLLHLQRFPR